VGPILRRAARGKPERSDRKRVAVGAAIADVCAEVKRMGQIDDAADKMKDATDKASDTAKDATEKSADWAKDSAKHAGDRMKDAGDRLKDAERRSRTRRKRGCCTQAGRIRHATADGVVGLPLRPRLVEERARAVVFRQHELEVAGVALEKRRLAVGEVKIPHTDEALIEAECADLVQACVVTLAPRVQRARVMVPMFSA